MASGSAQTQLLTKSDVNAYVDSSFSSQVPVEATGPSGYSMPFAPFVCPQVPIIDKPYRSFEPQAIPARGRAGQLGHFTTKGSGQSITQPSQPSAAGISNHGSGKISANHLGHGNHQYQFFCQRAHLSQPNPLLPLMS